MSNEEAKITQDMLMQSTDVATRIEASLSQSEQRKLSILSTKPKIPDLNVTPCSDSEGEEQEEIVETTQNSVGIKAQNADHVEYKLFYELEVEIFARVSCFQYWKLNFLNKKFSQLLQSGNIFKVRRERELVKPYVIMLSSGDTCWTMFDKDFKNFQKLPEIPSDDCFYYGDKETICAGTQLIVIRREVEGIVVWRYELEMHKWTKGPAMITPRVMYASASRGTDALFAGGIKMDEEGKPEVVSIAEKYDAETKIWTVIKGMHMRRKFSSGCFLHGKFYVIGGRNENDEYLTCGESYDEMTNSWTLVPDILKDMTFTCPQSPPLIAVVNENLYLLETSSNELLVYDFKANAWKELGIAPVRANTALGWGVAFKSIGDMLLVIGASSTKTWHKTMSVYTCRPSPNAEELLWEESIHCSDRVQLSHFIRNCCVKFAQSLSSNKLGSIFYYMFVFYINV